MPVNGAGIEFDADGALAGRAFLLAGGVAKVLATSDLKAIAPRWFILPFPHGRGMRASCSDPFRSIGGFYESAVH